MEAAACAVALVCMCLYCLYVVLSAAQETDGGPRASWVMSGLSPADRPSLPIVWVRLWLLDEQSSDPVKDKHNGAITDCHFPSAPLKHPLPPVAAEKVAILHGPRHALAVAY